MSLFTPVPDPATKLGRRRQLSPRASVHVSPLCLGGATIGDKWEKYGYGAMDKDSSFKLLDAFYEAGGNFIDTANNYQEGTSEEFIGEWSEKRGVRDELVIATKYGNFFKFPIPNQTSSFVGNGIKCLQLSVETSLRRLRTTYIDILYVHFWDLHTSIEEIMDGLHTLVLARKVLYLGISDAPAWLVVKANEYAKAHGKTPFVVYQGAYSILNRDLEREIMPMCHHEGIGLTLWYVLEAGKIRSDEEEEKRRQTGEKGRQIFGPSVSWERTADEKKICDALEVVRKQLDAKSITSVAIAYTMQKVPFVFPVLGGRKVEHLQSNIEALDIHLSKEQIDYLETIIPFNKGFPAKFFGDYSDGNYPPPMTQFVKYDPHPLLRPIKPEI